jgi:hypothetical protein
MDFNKLYKKIADLDQGRQILKESEQPIEECGMMGMSPMGGMDDRPTTMSVNMNASGAEGIRELLNILQGQGDDMPGGMDGPDGGPAGVLVGMDGPDGGDDIGPDGAPDMHDHGDEDPGQKPMLGKGPEMDEEFANTPSPSMGSVADMTPTGDDLSSKGGNEVGQVAGGGNPYTQPMAESLRGKLAALYHEIKTR